MMQYDRHGAKAEENYLRGPEQTATDHMTMRKMEQAFRGGSVATKEPVLPSWATAIVVAGGEGSRMGGIDKIFNLLRGKPIIVHTLEAFEAAPSIDAVVLVVPVPKLEIARALVASLKFSTPISVTSGGASRQRSVANGLALVGKSKVIMVHDGARPCVTVDIIERGIVAAEATGAAVVGLPMTDTVKEVQTDGGIVSVLRTVDRESLYTVQTPQVFLAPVLRDAHTQAGAAEDLTDDVGLAQKIGIRVVVYPGSSDNIKITTPGDLARAARILEERELK
jgi:2-C-methyl-D-erythritol 4-phosphate cytidylyltransferase